MYVYKYMAERKRGTVHPILVLGNQFCLQSSWWQKKSSKVSAYFSLVEQFIDKRVVYGGKLLKDPSFYSVVIFNPFYNPVMVKTAL